jgi:phosphoglycerol transferase MdoB-like AlkP superfamily enzyme
MKKTISRWGGKYPNIVVIMNESFSDLRVLGNFETDVPFLENWDSLNENVIKGWANVSVYGGNTANSEFEFLSSDMVGAFGGKIAFSTYFKVSRKYLGLTSHLIDLGYDTMAFHTYYGRGWNRRNVWNLMGFEQEYFLEDLDGDLDKIRSYVSDTSDYSIIKNYFEEKDSDNPSFVFNVTMQNHGGYSTKEFESTVHILGEDSSDFPQTEEYLSLIRISDEAIADLLDFFADYDEPVIVVMFGDHQPNLETEFYEYVYGLPENEWTQQQKWLKYKTPFIIWHNYNTDYQEIGDVSLNYLAAIVLKDAGIPLTQYQQYVLNLREAYPVISEKYLIDKEGNYYSENSDEYKNNTFDYRMLIYNHTVDKDNSFEYFFK